MNDDGLLSAHPGHRNRKKASTPTGTALSGLPHFTPKAKRVIYLFQSGGPSQLDLFDEKTAMKALRGQDLPDSVRMGQRLTGGEQWSGQVPGGHLDLSFSSAW